MFTLFVYVSLMFLGLGFALGYWKGRSDERSIRRLHF